ncbi:unnamed protein product [Merluccius merluccius]
MDSADPDQVKSALEMHGTMLGDSPASFSLFDLKNQLEVLSRQVESVATGVTGLAAQIQQIQLTLSSPGGHPDPQPPGQRAREPRLPPPETYSGNPGS